MHQSSKKKAKGSKLMKEIGFRESGVVCMRTRTLLELCLIEFNKSQNSKVHQKINALNTTRKNHINHKTDYIHRLACGNEKLV